jgi:TatD DNase family protein
MHDSHTHLTIQPLSENIDSALDDFKHKGGKWLLNASHDIESLNEVIQIQKKFENMYPDMIKTALGLHPEIYSESMSDVYKTVKKNLDRFEKVFENNRERISAIGETGLDYYHINNDESLSNTDREQIIEAQKTSLRRQLEIALEHNLPLTLHTRDTNGSSQSTQDLLRLIAEVGNGRLRGSFHSFTGSQAHLSEILDLGFYVGFNGIITYPSGGNVRELLSNAPLDRILFETDAPLLPPQSVRKNKKKGVGYCRPGDVNEVIETASEVLNIEFEKLVKQTNENFENLFLN